jgi:hypothetical protein
MIDDIVRVEVTQVMKVEDAEELLEELQKYELHKIEE